MIRWPSVFLMDEWGRAFKRSVLKARMVAVHFFNPTSCPHYRAEASGHVVEVAIDNGGSGYTGEVGVSFSGGGANPVTATATAHVTAGVIDRIDVTDGGRNYETAPDVAISGNGNGAAAHAVMGGTERLENITKIPSNYIQAVGDTIGDITPYVVAENDGCPPAPTNPPSGFKDPSPNPATASPSPISVDPDQSNPNVPGYFRLVPDPQDVDGHRAYVPQPDLPPNGDPTTPGAQWNPGTGAEIVQGNVFKSYSTKKYLNVFQCLKRGFKNVQARKVWHGRYGLDPTQTTVKYLACSRTVRVTLSVSDFDTCEVDHVASAVKNVTSTVNRWSGVRHHTESIQSDDFAVTGAQYAPLTVDGFAAVFSTEGQFPPASYQNPAGFCVSGPITDEEVAANNQPWRATEYEDDEQSPNYGLPTAYEMSSCWRNNTDLNLRVTKTSLCTESGGEQWQIEEFELNLSLSQPYTREDLKADVDYLLGLWNLGDDVLYPWRVDYRTGIAPLVMFRELSEPTNPDAGLGGFECRDTIPDGGGWKTHTETYPGQEGSCTGGYYDAGYAQELIYTGGSPDASVAVIGAPLPKGRDWYFNFEQKNYALVAGDWKVVSIGHSNFFSNSFQKRSVIGAVIRHRGSGYGQNTTVSFTGGDAISQATASIVIRDGYIAEISIDFGGSYDGVPTIEITDPDSPPGTGAVITPIMSPTRYPDLPHATNWINEYEERFFAPARGAWYAFNYTFNIPGDSLLLADTLIAQSWAEVILWERPAHNWLRPCGKDRLTMGYLPSCTDDNDSYPCPNSASMENPRDCSEVSDEGCAPFDQTYTLTTSSPQSQGCWESGHYCASIPLTLVAGDRIRATTVSSLDTILYLLDSNGTMIAQNDDFPGLPNNNSRLEFTIPTTGDYTLEATTYNQGATGDIEVQLECLVANAAQQDTYACTAPVEGHTGSGSVQAADADCYAATLPEANALAAAKAHTLAQRDSLCIDIDWGAGPSIETAGDGQVINSDQTRNSFLLSLQASTTGSFVYFTLNGTMPYDGNGRTATLALTVTYDETAQSSMVFGDFPPDYNGVYEKYGQLSTGNYTLTFPAMYPNPYWQRPTTVHFRIQGIVDLRPIGPGLKRLGIYGVITAD